MMKISTFFIVTEPEKMGFPYLESIEAASKFSDEIVVVCGRSEDVSKKRILDRIPSAKIVETNSWPEDWHYDSMRDHLGVGLNSCTGDICLKCDADNVFRTSQAKEIRSALLAAAENSHRITLGRINFFHSDLFRSNKNRVIYAINKKLCKEDGISVEITHESGSNQPKFSDEIRETYIEEMILWPINYDNTFMNSHQIADKWIRWSRAFSRFKNEKIKFELNDFDHALVDYVNYQRGKIHGAERIENFHPRIIRERISNLTPKLWGYNNFANLDKEK